jgi:hypothetical protein
MANPTAKASLSVSPATLFMISPPEIFKTDEALPFARAALVVNDETAHPQIIPFSPLQKKPSVKHFLFLELS